MNRIHGLIEEKDTKEEDKPDETVSILDQLIEYKVIIPDPKLQTDTIHTNSRELYVEAGRNVDIKVKLFDEEEGVVLYLNQICIVSIATQAKHFSHGMCAFRPTKDVLHVSIIDIAPDFKKVFLFKQNDLASSPLTIRASPKDNDPGYSVTTDSDAKKGCCPFFLKEEDHASKNNQVFLFDDESNNSRHLETESEDKKQTKRPTSEQEPIVISVTTVPKGPPPKKL